MFTDSVFINYFSYYEEMSFLPSYMTLIDAKGKSLLYYYKVALAFNKKKLFKFHFNFERGPIYFIIPTNCDQKTSSAFLLKKDFGCMLPFQLSHQFNILNFEVFYNLINFTLF